MKDAKTKFKILAAVVVIIIVIVVLIWAWLGKTRSPYGEGALDSFAQCLASKGAVMYGAYWCSHCQNQKAVFGNSFQHVTYVECTRETQRCLDAGIAKYPTWIVSGGTRLVGERPLPELSLATGCPLPPKGK